MWADILKRIRPITSLLKQGVKFVFMPSMETIARTPIEELPAPPVLVYADWDAVADNSRIFVLYCDPNVDGFGATLEQEQKDSSIRPILFISRATLKSVRHVHRSISRLEYHKGSANGITEVLYPLPQLPSIC